MTIREIRLASPEEVLRFAGICPPARNAVERRIEGGHVTYRIVCDDGAAPFVRISCFPPGGWRVGSNFTTDHVLDGTRWPEVSFAKHTENFLRALGVDPAEALDKLRALGRQRVDTARVAASPGSRHAEVELSYQSRGNVGGYEVCFSLKNDVEDHATKTFDPAFTDGGYEVFHAVE